MVWYKDYILILSVSVIFVLDQISKYAAKELLRYGESWPESGIFRFTHVTNSGTAFGLFKDATPILVVASFIAIGFLIYFYRTHIGSRRILRLAIGMLMGGALGNLLDRIMYGSVVDFIDVGWWPVFNLADSSIVVGMFILAYVMLFDSKASPSQEDHKTDEFGEGDM